MKEKRGLTCSDMQGIELKETKIPAENRPEEIYSWSDMLLLQRMASPEQSFDVSLATIDDLLARDKQRKKDGWPEKIKVGKIMRPGQGGRGNTIIVVPTTREEKFYHGRFNPSQPGGGGTGGQGEGEEGEVVGESPVDSSEGEEGDNGAGQGGGGEHGISGEAYEMGKMLTEKFELPNLKDKGKKVAVDRYVYDLTDRHRGAGQVMDKKATMRRIVRTNVALGKLDRNHIDLTKLMVAPDDKVYRVLSREKDYESQAMVFFIRDYSGSMNGTPTKVVVSQHLMVYSWLVYQYAERVKERFILHDAEAKEVPDFYTYYHSAVAGGTKVSSGYRLVNKIVYEENLARDYNIYVFHGTDGDDWDKGGKETIPEVTEMLGYANRIGITVVRNRWSSDQTEVEEYFHNSGLLNAHKKILRLDSMKEDEASEERIIEGIKKLVSEKE